MKKLILSLSLMASIALFAQQTKSELNLSRFDASQFTMIFDATIYGQPSTDFRVLDIVPGMHSMQVFRIEKYRKYDGKWDEKFVIIFSGMIDIPENARITALIDQYNKYNVVSTERLHEEHHRREHHDELPPAPPCMSDEQFKDLKRSVASKSFEDTKVAVAKQAIQANGTSTHQVVELMEMLNFESSKLELAKYAYSYSIDKNNYYLVNDGFTFSSSIDDLNEYIESQRR